MCSVVGYIGKNHSKSYVIDGLSRLEYRGYDAAGFACLTDRGERLAWAKVSGRLSNLVDRLNQDPIDGFVGVGHTRWSTHGSATRENAHPHFDCEQKIAIVHNGVIENHYDLRKILEGGGHFFHSQTDTETVAHFFEALLVAHETFKGAVVDLVNRLEGAYALVCIFQDHPDLMLLVRKRSPLCIGIGDDEMFVASDPLAFAGKTKKVLFVPDESFVLMRKDLIELYDFQGKTLPVTVQDLDISWDEQGKQGYEHFMLKEIYEQKNAIHSTVNFLRTINAASPNSIWEYVGLTSDYVERLNKINLIGCGTSWHAARIGQFFFEDICLMPARVHLASEFRYSHFFPEEQTCYLAMSQSGETADTLEALRLLNGAKQPTVAITNVASSTLVREAGGFLLTQAGPEVAVASTKAFSTQLTVLYWLSHRIALQKGIITQQRMEQAEHDLLVCAEILENTIENYRRDIVATIAPMYAHYTQAIFLGRHISYPFAMEAALKLKEIAYIFSQCYPAGEIKHGPLALVDEKTPVFIFSHQDPVIYKKLLSNAQEVKARNGKIIAFAFEGQDELRVLADTSFVVPPTRSLLGQLAMTGLMQFLVYSIARQLNRPIDKPRNLAKSVTVE